MSNGYRNSSSSNRRAQNNNERRRQDRQNRKAPLGFEYMDDGTLRRSSQEDNWCGPQSFLDPESSPKSTPVGYHIWHICAMHVIQNSSGGMGNAIPGFNPSMWVFGQPSPATTGLPGTVVNLPASGYSAPFSFWGNPLLQQPGPNFGYNLFYDWVVQEVGPISVGDKIEFDCSMTQAAWPLAFGGGGITNSPNMTRPYSAICIDDMIGLDDFGGTNLLCLEYMGWSNSSSSNQALPWTYPSSGPPGSFFSTNVMTAKVSLNTCNCHGGENTFGLDPSVHITPPSTWNCVKKKVMGQGTGGTPYTYNCEEIHYPLVGSFSSLLGTPVVVGGPQLPGAPTIYANDGCLANCGPQTSSVDPKASGGALYYEK